jgi:hypothetical protein
VWGDIPGRQLRSGEKVGSGVGKTTRGKGTKRMVLVAGGGFPLGVRLENVPPGEVTLAEATPTEVKAPRPKGRPRQKPKRVIDDRAYVSDPLRERLAVRGIDLIALEPQEAASSVAMKMGANSGTTCADGSSNEPTLGSVSSADRSCDVSIYYSSTGPPSISLATGSHCGGVYESRSHEKSASVERSASSSKLNC